MYSFVVTNICTNMNERERVLAIKGAEHLEKAEADGQRDAGGGGRFFKFFAFFLT